jgi:putative addiction module antidote
MQHLKVRKIGNSLGVVLPKELLAQFGVDEGDELIVSETPVMSISTANSKLRAGACNVTATRSGNSPSE